MYKQKEGVARKYNSADTPFLLHSPVQMKYATEVAHGARNE